LGNGKDLWLGLLLLRFEFRVSVNVIDSVPAQMSGGGANALHSSDGGGDSRQILQVDYERIAWCALRLQLAKPYRQPDNCSRPRIDVRPKKCILTARQKKGTNFLLCASLLILDRIW